MIRFKRHIGFLFFFMTIASIYGQQQQQYTQYVHNKLYLNPGFAGDQDYTSLSLIYRDQWNGLTGAPQSQVFSANFKGFDKLGLGFVLDRQTIGIQSAFNFSGMYAYKLIINDLTISTGINASFRRYSEDYTKSSLIAIEGLTNDPSIPEGKIDKNIINAGVGVYIKANNFYFGASSPRLIKSNLDTDNNTIISEEVRHFYIMGGASFYINKDLTISPHSLIKLAKNSPFDIDFMMSATWEEKYTLGLNYRYGGNAGGIGESIDLIFNFQLNENLMFGLAQDFTLSDISSYENGSLEALVRYDFVKKKPKTIMVNPRFF